jgi:hypothetical protein|tara:strand:- start:4898 stop:5251 length:354 start_codon:yes stop_codon:yes gene_type:complete
MSYINRLFGSIGTGNPQQNLNGNIDENRLISIDTSNNRIGINTINPECSIDISGNDAKLKTKYLEVSGDISYNIDGRYKSINTLHGIVKKLYIDNSNNDSFTFNDADRINYGTFFDI